MPTLLWFRRDLRLADNPALQAALKRKQPVIPVFIWAPDEETPWEPGAANRWWLHQSLTSLAADLQAAGSKLVLRCGPACETLQRLTEETGATAVYWNRRYEPSVLARDARIKASLRTSGIEAESFNAALLHEPWTIQNKSEKPFQVFTPFWRHCLTLPDPPEPLPTPKKVPAPVQVPASVALEEFGLEPRIKWAEGFRAAWKPGSAGAREQLKRFITAAFENYSEERNRPDHLGTSRLSPHLHFGEISPRQVWHALRRSAGSSSAWRNSQFLAEVGWREFAHHLLYHFPHTPTEPLRGEFKSFPWRDNPAWLKAWQRGQTGVPLVDAGMRELWITGWMHNRVRMVVASFLVKNLLLPWQEGTRWFWDTLVDADLAQNTLGWQWSAGCGADAAPYFRIFNPVSQGEKFDPDGDYVRQWVPELAKLPAPWIHQPWTAPAAELTRASVILGKTYPDPIVSLSISREVALEAYSRMRTK
jgi:deoxyribodipyrimidine photo-lyase